MGLSVEHLARRLVLGALLDELTRLFGSYELVAHWTQGEFHHDVVLRLPDAGSTQLPGRVLVVATNCNGGVKEVLCFAEVPDRAALWHARCPNIPEFAGELAPVPFLRHGDRGPQAAGSPRMLSSAVSSRRSRRLELSRAAVPAAERSP